MRSTSLTLSLEFGPGSTPSEAPVKLSSTVWPIALSLDSTFLSIRAHAPGWGNTSFPTEPRGTTVWGRLRGPSSGATWRRPTLPFSGLWQVKSPSCCSLLVLVHPPVGPCPPTYSSSKVQKLMGSCLPQGTRLRAGHITGTPNMSVGVASPCILEEMVSCGGSMSPPNSSSSPNSGPEDRQTQHRQFDKSSYEHMDTQYDCLLPLQNGVPAGEEEGLAELAQTHPSKGEAIQLPLRHFWLRSHFICTPNRSGGRHLWEGGC